MANKVEGHVTVPWKSFLIMDLIQYQQMCLSELCCYTAIWQKFVTGVMRFGRIDVTEGQLVVAFIHILYAISPSIFDKDIPGLNLPLRYACVIGSMVSTILFIIQQLSIILKGRSSKRTSTAQTPVTLFPAIPIGLAIGLQVIVAMTTSVFQDLHCLYLITFGLIESKITVRLIVAHVTKGRMPLFDRILLGPILLLLISQLNGSILLDRILLLCVCVYSLQNWIFYFWTVAIEICEHLNIYCFNVTSRPHPYRRMPPG
ncbi:choline/ethanolaminephosphotransferase 1-like isoform X2 [Mercenaria mercenaria]|uniref:choline/ethanolaminephosphotransferase 1-like isoform X2 n=1 Tax=Mercenaria mercenaria TaxID=6596 RepID=UPI00234E7AE8|nr:choline/ethanolaminephosphotransferase 1-like isoform X2 [Mercenaria mercenaria]